MALGFRVGQHVLALSRLERNPEAMASFADAKALEATDFRLKKCWKAVAASWRRYQIHCRTSAHRYAGDTRTHQGSCGSSSQSGAT